MEKHNLDLQKTELRQILLKTNKQDLSQDKVGASEEKTEINAVDVNELINWQQIEEVSSSDNTQLMLGNAQANQSSSYVANQTDGIVIEEMHPMDRSQFVVVNVTGQDYYSDESILEQKINSLGFNVSAIRSYLDKKVSSFSREEIFEMFEKIRPQLRSFVGQKLYNAGIDFNWEFIDDVLDRILSQWEYSNNAIGGPNQKRDFKFTKVIDLLQTIRNRINLAVSYGIKGDDHYYTSDEILEGSFYGSYKTLMYNLLYTDDRYLNPEEIELKTALWSLEQDNNGDTYNCVTLSISEYEEKINEFSELFKNYLKSKFNYSDNFINSILNFAKGNINIISFGNSIIGSIKGYVKQFEENIFKLIQVPKMDRHDSYIVFEEESSTGEAYCVEYDINLFDEYPNNLYAVNFLNFFLYVGDSSEFQTKFISSELYDIINGLGLEGSESKALMRIIFKRIAEKLGIKRDEYGLINLCKKDFEKLNYDILIKADCSWIDEVFDIIHEEASKIRHMDQSEWEAATSLNYDELFKFGNLNAKSFEENFDEMLLSNDPGIRKLAHMIEIAWKNNDCFTVKEKQSYIKWLIVLLNEQAGVQNPNGNPSTTNVCITSELLDKLGSNIFDKTEEVINSEKLRKCLLADVDGVIDKFSQGLYTGDCWLLAGITAVNSTPAGKELFANSIRWNSDYTAIMVTFPGTGDTVVITVDELINADPDLGNDYYNNGDNDVLALVYAYEKLYGDIEGGDSKNFFMKFLPSYGRYIKSTGTSEGKGLDDLVNYVGGFFDGGGGRIDLSDSTVYEYLQDILNAKKNGQNVAATFSLKTGGDTTYSWTTIDGEEVYIELDHDGWADWGGHAFAITDITATTVTFINPWDSSITYTVTWSEFANIGIGDITWATWL